MKAKRMTLIDFALAVSLFALVVFGTLAATI